MTASGPVMLWAVATAGSLAIHAAVGYTLFAMPMPEVRQETITEIRFATPEDGTATTLDSFSQTEAVSPRHGLARASSPVPSTARAGSSSANVAPAASEAEPLVPAEATALDAIAPTALPQRAPDVAVAAVAEARPLAPTTPASSRAGQPERLEAIPAADPPPALAAQPVETAEAPEPAMQGPVPVEAAKAVPLPPSTAAPTAAAATVQEIAALSAADPVEPIGTRNARVIAVRPDAAQVSLAPNTPLPPAGTTVIAPSSRNAAPLAAPNVTPALQGPRATAPVAAPASGAPVQADPAPSPKPVVAARTESVRPVGKETGRVAAVAVTPKASAAPTPVAPAGSASRTVEGVVATPPPVTAEPVERETALLAPPRPQTGSDEEPSESGDATLVRDFLRGREGDDCLLAVPSEGAGATVEAFTASTAAVTKLTADFERQAHSKLATNVRSVLQSQCSALGFARALPQYPNYLLKVEVARPDIRSGESLEGIVSGLTKDTLYLVAVDDEGYAKLVESHSGLAVDTFGFSEPVHLTGPAVSSVQLLIAIGSDGPLTSMPTREGLPADLFFSRLAIEIVSGNRSIAFGMGSFVLR